MFRPTVNKPLLHNGQILVGTEQTNVSNTKSHQLRFFLFACCRLQNYQTICPADESLANPRYCNVSTIYSRLHEPPIFNSTSLKSEIAAKDLDRKSPDLNMANM